MTREISVESSTSETIQTTIGDLVEAITQIALEAGKTEAEGYKLASLTIESLLRRTSKPKRAIQ